MNTHADWIDTTQPIDLSLEAGGCAHTHHLHSVLPSSKGCQECLKDGSAWVHLRVCMECGHVGCCDSSPGKHATGHFHATQHPIMRSIQPAESWGWCYIDQDYV